MERLECKTVKGHSYYYYSHWARVDGRPRRVWQKYLGKLDDIVQAVQGGGKAPVCAEVFDWGLPEALWRECCRADIVACVNRQCGRTRSRALSTGDYLALAALNRAIQPHSKRSLWRWFSQTVLVRHFPEASQKRLTSQRFWDHMERIKEADILPIWQSILERLVHREGLDLAAVCYDGTNYYTFIDTFNTHCDIARRGKNKQGRDSLRQVSYALFCCADGQVPLYFDVYEGNRNDSKQFPLLLNKFQQFLQRVAGPMRLPETTLIFDKGNNSADNFALLDELPLFFVGSVKLDEHKDLLQIANDDPRFTACAAERLPGTKAFHVTKKVYGRERTVVVTYNQNLFNAQWLTLQNDMAKASAKLAALQQRLDERDQGLIKGGKTPTSTSIKNQCAKILSRQHLKKVITVSVSETSNGRACVQYGVDATALRTLANTYLGKTLLLSNRSTWSDEQIIEAYRSQFLIEDVFKESKDRRTGSWWPMHHWTDSKIRVHGLYCTIAHLLRALLLRRVRQAGLQLSLKRLLAELGGIREVINIYPSKRGQKTAPQHTVLSRRSALQSQLTSILRLEEAKTAS
jgi:transposase